MVPHPALPLHSMEGFTCMPQTDNNIARSMTREDLIFALVQDVVRIEGPNTKIDRAYLLKLVAEIARSVDGK
ncbi:hypothetical protein J3T99_07510 [Acetobacteraceae bacterium B3987]|nr:hypothetical protein [Acetobacteraceae bacterium B3987]